jgi:hypothetical protein
MLTATRQINGGKSVAAIAMGIAYASLFPAPALAEVMDKEPTQVEIWLFTGGFLVIELLVSKWRYWLPLLIWPITAAVAGGFFWDELLVSYVGPDIRIEAGWNYIILSCLAIGINFSMPVVIAIFARSSHRIIAK